MQKDTIRLLLMGPCTNKKFPEISGGAVVLFNELQKELNKKNVHYPVIDTNKQNYINPFFAYISIIIRIILEQKGCTHLSLHSSRDYIILAPLIIFIGSLFGKRTSLRKFGGEAVETYKESRGVKKYILKFIFSHINTLFLETKYLVEFFLKINNNTFWFPNVRNRVLQPTMPRMYQKRFVFISHVIRQKGVDEIIEACNQLDDSYTVDIFGPILDKKYTKEYFTKRNVSYQGALKAIDVIAKLNEYDIVLLPSYKEGYPGIIIEAYTLGIPVIATSLQAIKEIVDPHKTGLLVEPKNTRELLEAIMYFNEVNYVDMSKNAYKKFDDFESDQQTKKFLERL